ncbi:MAG: nitroreductase family protein [Eubacteriales bacterium]
MNDLYNMIFKRKSFRRFKSSKSLSTNDLQEIQNQLTKLKPLKENITVKYRIVQKEKTTCKRGEFCLLVYSETKEHYLLNIGYMLEQLDLWMASKDIGVCWYGMGKTNELEYEGLPFVIMLAFGKGDKEEFRQDYTKAKRKKIEEIWKGEILQNIGNVVRFAPSACNTQPWVVENMSNHLNIYRDSKKKSMMPKSKVTFFNTIDMGIFICFLEIVLKHEKYNFDRLLCEENLAKREKIKIAEYILS